MEVDREEMRILTHRQFQEFFEKSKLINPMGETLTDIYKIGCLLQVANCVNNSIGVKFTVSLQLAYKTIDNLGTDRHTKWKQRMENG